jgi:hypothetical protein
MPETIEFCYRHPGVETGLHCARCGNAICVKCARKAPVGYLCPDCVHAQENRFYNGGNMDYFLAALVALPLSLLAGALFGLIIANLGFFAWIVAFFAAPAAGGFIAEAVRRVVQRRRSRYLGHIVAGCVVLGALPFFILALLMGNIFGLIVPGVLMVLGGGAAYARLH